MSFYIRRGEIQEGLKELAEASNAPSNAIGMVFMLIDALNSVTEMRKMTEYVSLTIEGLSAIERVCGSSDNPVRDLQQDMGKFYNKYLQE